jgi:hypothetical protein
MQLSRQRPTKALSLSTRRSNRPCRAAPHAASRKGAGVGGIPHGDIELLAGAQTTVGASFVLSAALTLGAAGAHAGEEVAEARCSRSLLQLRSFASLMPARAF